MTHHLSDPCRHCGLARDAVPVGECVGADLAALATAWADAAVDYEICGDNHAQQAGVALDAAESAFHAALAANAARVERYRVALGRISKPGYGIEMGDDDAARADYWTKVALRYRDIATDALRVQAEGAHDAE